MKSLFYGIDIVYTHHAMSYQSVIDSATATIKALKEASDLEKSAFQAMPPMPAGPGTDPMAGAPPVDPATGAPMAGPPMGDPAAMGMMPPGGAPMAGPPMGDPAAMGMMPPGGAPMPAQDPAAMGMDQVVGALEQTVGGMETLQQENAVLREGFEALSGEMEELRKAIAGPAARA